MRPSEENRISFWLRERAMRSWVSAQVVVDVRDLGQSQPDLEGC